jgi:DNA-directed RNA polymerase specialized sigma24 family protein
MGRQSFGRQDCSPVFCYGDMMAIFADMRLSEGSHELGIGLMRAVEELEDPMQRTVMLLSLVGYNFREIAGFLTKENGPEDEQVTHETVRSAHDEARDIIKKKLGLPAA